MKKLFQPQRRKEHVSSGKYKDVKCLLGNEADEMKANSLIKNFNLSYDF